MVFTFCKLNCISSRKLWGRCFFECILNFSIRKWGIFSSYKNLTNQACRHITSNYDLRSAGMSLVYLVAAAGTSKKVLNFLVTHQVHCSRTQNYISSVPRYLCTIRPTYSWSRILFTTLRCHKRFFSLWFYWRLKYQYGFKCDFIKSWGLPCILRFTLWIA